MWDLATIKAMNKLAIREYHKQLSEKDEGMRDITPELENRNCLICLHCGSIFEGASREERDSDNCPHCGGGWFNYVSGEMHWVFWGSPVAYALADGKLKEFKEGGE